MRIRKIYPPCLRSVWILPMNHIVSLGYREEVAEPPLLVFHLDPHLFQARQDERENRTVACMECASDDLLISGPRPKETHPDSFRPKISDQEAI